MLRQGGCAILTRMTGQDWIRELQARGLDGPTLLLLDIIEPLAAPGAQFLWVAQPFSGLFGAAELTGRLARLLQEPDGIDRLREMLESGR